LFGPKTGSICSRREQKKGEGHVTLAIEILWEAEQIAVWRERNRLGTYREVKKGEMVRKKAKRGAVR